MGPTMRVDIPDDRPRLELELDDGTKIWVSPLTADDKHVIEEGFQELSIESRFSRFGQGRGHLTEGELDYLSDVDQRFHVAWGASTTEREGIGVGRYITMEEPGCAEVALTVMDRWQGRGVGKLLLRVLAAVAREDGIPKLCFKFLPGNNQIRTMLRDIEVHFDEKEGLMSGVLSVDRLPVADWEPAVVELIDQFRD